MKFLVIEDQPLLREILSTALTEAGFNVFAFESAEAFYEQDITLKDFNVAIIDISLPGMDGLELSSQLRQAWPHLGIIMLTMHKTIEKKLQGYEAGVDIYLTKPIQNEELIATSKALIKRLSSISEPENSMLNFDPVKQKVFFDSDSYEGLSFKEAKTLNAFLKAQNKQLEYWELLEINQLDFDDKGRKQLEVMVSRLRQKLTKLTNNPQTIQSIRGFGYQLTIAIKQVN